MKNKYNKFSDFLEKIVETLGVTLLGLMVLVIGIQVFCRYFLNFTPSWSEDISLLFMIWFSFLGIALGVKRDTHLSIEVFYSRFSKGFQNFINIFNYILIIFFSYILLTRGIVLVKMTLRSTIPSLGIPTSNLYIAIPIMSGLIIVFLIQKFIKYSRRD
ncbi:MAG: TRAP transporter small permease [Sarcina sp.]